MSVSLPVRLFEENDSQRPSAEKLRPVLRDLPSVSITVWPVPRS